MILNFIMGFVFGLTFALIALLAMAWNNIQQKKKNNSSTFDIKGSEDKKKD